MPRVSETLVIEERIYRVEKVVHRIQVAVPEHVEDSITSAPRVISVEVNE
jgi:hypothetical protein